MRKSKPQLLGEFINLLFRHDPMGICFEDNPDKENEYDGEALSILARFVEFHVIELEPEAASETALTIIQNTFAFWFSSPLVDVIAAKCLGDELLTAFRAAYPEQKTDPEVVSANEERAGDGSVGLPGVTPDETPPRSG